MALHISTTVCQIRLNSIVPSFVVRLPIIAKLNGKTSFRLRCRVRASARNEQNVEIERGVRPIVGNHEFQQRFPRPQRTLHFGKVREKDSLWTLPPHSSKYVSMPLEQLVFRFLLRTRVPESQLEAEPVTVSPRDGGRIRPPILLAIAYSPKQCQ
jgi:hypothetical protein